jgi:pilus assembly protein Flp/PilA
MITPIRTIAAWASARSRDERAAALIEYALLVGLIAIICIAAMATFGTNTNSSFSTVASPVAEA